MNAIEPIQMDSRAADAAFREYRDVLKGEHTAADSMICRLYRALRRQSRVLNIADAFRVTGLDEMGRPQLAMMRADKEGATLWDTWDNDIAYMRPPRGISTRGKIVEFTLHAKWFGAKKFVFNAAKRRNTAKLPIIPPRFRPAQDQLHKYWILWEAAWDRVPVDPFLLRPLGGPFYVIVAQWDLSPVERMVMEFQNRKG